MEKVFEVENRKLWLVEQEDGGPEAKMVGSSTYSDDGIPGCRAETNTIMTMRNTVVQSTLPCWTHSDCGK